MNKAMYILLIVVGIILISIGIFGLSKSNHIDDNIYFEETSVIPEAGNVNPQPEALDLLVETAETKPSAEIVSQSQISDSTTITNKEKGNLFEGYVADCFKDRSCFRVLEWNQGTTSPEGVYAENVVNPDFHIEQVFSPTYKIDYYIEAKYLSKWGYDNTIQLKKYQIDRYRLFQKDTHRKIILAIGVGGEPSNPENFYLVPLDSIKDVDLSMEFLRPFATNRKAVKNYIGFTENI